MAELAQLVQRELRWPVESIYMGPWGHDVFRLTSRLRFKPPDTWRTLVAERETLLARGERPPSLGEAMTLEVRRRLSGNSNGETRRTVVRATAWPWLCFRWARGHLRYWAFLWVLLIELWRRYATVYVNTRHGRCVICDRYVYDLLTGEMHSLNSRYQAARALVCRLVPKPDATILLWNDAETLLQRKQQLSKERLEAFLSFYDHQSRIFGFTRVRTDVPADEVARRIISACFEQIVAIRRT